MGEWRYIAQIILNLGTQMEVSGQLHALPALPLGKEPRIPLDGRLGGPQIHSGHGGEEKNSQPPPGIET